MTAAIQDSLVSMGLASIVLLAAVFAQRAVVRTRLHRSLANREFKRRYRAEHPLNDRTAALAPLPPPALPGSPVSGPAGVSQTPARARRNPAWTKHELEEPVRGKSRLVAQVTSGCAARWAVHEDGVARLVIDYGDAELVLEVVLPDQAEWFAVSLAWAALDVAGHCRNLMDGHVAELIPDVDAAAAAYVLAVDEEPQQPRERHGWSRRRFVVESEMDNACRTVGSEPARTTIFARSVASRPGTQVGGDVPGPRTSSPTPWLRCPA